MAVYMTAQKDLACHVVVRSSGLSGADPEAVDQVWISSDADLVDVDLAAPQRSLAPSSSR
jgi:hypothetical protein